ncbi:cytoplasmic protein [Salmonella enterica subsp. enterica serovar Enteritidis]|nr:cytoplasmic protein [Salmonella enterica subsp. enterica serovar Enteritidis]
MMPTDGNDNIRKQDGAVFGQPEVKPIPETLQCTEKWRQVAPVQRFSDIFRTRTKNQL